MLFHTSEGTVQAPQKCAMPTNTKASLRASRRRLGEVLISEEDAELACAKVDKDDRDSCIADILATNDKSMAGAY